MSLHDLIFFFLLILIHGLGIFVFYEFLSSKNYVFSFFLIILFELEVEF